MIQFFALCVGFVAGYLPDALFGSHLSFVASLLLGTLFGSVGYWFTLRWLRNLRG